jgi:ATP-dependent Clp protease ATP-binding subunit ClpC
MVDPTSIDETIEILHNIKGRYEDHHNVIYTDEAIEGCVKLTARYITDRYLPDKAIDALDEVGSRVHISNINVPDKIIKLEEKIENIKEEKISAVKSQNFELAANHRDKEKNLLNLLEKEKENWEKELINHRETVDELKVAEVVAMMSGVPVQRIAQAEGKRLMNMASDMKNNVVGQDEAITKIVKAIQRNRAGLKDPNRPIGSFIFLGPTGVGKTQLAKVLATYLFDSVDSLIRIDMSEYMEKFSVSRIVGAPPGYVGYEEGGQLTEKVRRKPYSVVLLDEIEKAHPDVFHLLLQVLDEGRLTDSLGRNIDFKNTIIIMTSNIGSRQLKDFGQGVGFNLNKTPEGENENAKYVVQKALKKAFAPEFLNRIDDVVIFNQLSKKDIHKIIDIEIKDLYKRVESLNYKLKLSPAAKDFIAEKGYDPQFGARPLKRAIQKYLEDEMAEIIIKASISEGDTISVGFDKKNEKLQMRILSVKKELN